MTLGVSREEFEALLTSEKVRDIRNTSRTSTLVAVRTTCCDKVIPVLVPQNSVEQYLMYGEFLPHRETHCENTELTPPKEENKTSHVCKRCHTVKEDYVGQVGEMCTVCDYKEFFEVQDNASKEKKTAVSKDIEVRPEHIRHVCLYHRGLRRVRAQLNSLTPGKTAVYPGCYIQDGTTTGGTEDLNPLGLIHGTNIDLKEIQVSGG